VCILNAYQINNLLVCVKELRGNMFNSIEPFENKGSPYNFKCEGASYQPSIINPKWQSIPSKQIRT